MQKLAKVLLVDDDATATFLNSLLLKRLEVAEQLLVAHNGAEAYQTLIHICSEAEEPGSSTLVLLDVNMPIMNGVEFLEAYQHHSLCQKHHLVIVVLTSSEHCRDVQRIKALPAPPDILTKPLTREKVETILHRHFPQRSPA